MEFYTQDINEILVHFESSLNGLSDKKAYNLLKNKGRNEIEDTKKKSFISVFFSQFKDFMIVILLISAVISLSV